MIEIINVNDDKWNKIINGFQCRDIYFTSEFFELSTVIDDGEPVLFYFQNECGKVAYPFLKRKINSGIFNDNLYDITTPYGYGGPLYAIDGNINEFSRAFSEAFKKYCENERIISEFIRFHPLTESQNISNETLKVEQIRHTICLSLENENENFMENIPSKTRNMIRKAMKNEINVKELNSMKYLDEFLEIYNETMSRNSATSYYYFSHAYFERLIKLMGPSLKMFGAYFEGELISVTLIMCYGDFMHYHLSGAKQNFLYTGVNNLLLYEIAKWGNDNGYKYFHLGGGYKGDNDNLFKFKKSFTKNGIQPFCIGKAIHDNSVYQDLVDEKDISTDSGFFPLYRS